MKEYIRKNAMRKFFYFYLKFNGFLKKSAVKSHFGLIMTLRHDSIIRWGAAPICGMISNGSRLTVDRKRLHNAKAVVK